MSGVKIFLFEWKHFVKNPFKIVAVLLFVIAGLYGLHNGASLFQEQQGEINDIQAKAAQARAEIIAYYDAGKKGPQERPWVDVTNPYWAIWYTSVYAFKSPSPAMVYSIGQAEQFGYYKRVSFRSSPYDSDMAEEIANPERLQAGTLDFAFVLLYLLPVVLLVLTYNLKSYESEQGFWSLVVVQHTSHYNWLLSRFAFYVLVTSSVVLLLFIYGGFLTGVFSLIPDAAMKFFGMSMLYLMLWASVFFVIVAKGRRILSNSLLMIGVYLLLCFIVPGAVHQQLSVEKPRNLMTDYIDATRDKKSALYEKSSEELSSALYRQFPSLATTPVAKDSVKSKRLLRRSLVGLTNEVMKESMQPFERESEEKNQLIASSFWYNPVGFFQNSFNEQSKTHYVNYKAYRETIQSAIDLQIKVLLKELYNDVEVTKKQYQDYLKQFNHDS